jgi:hypothetical protein
MADEIHIAVPGHREVLRFSESVRLGRTDENDVVVDDEFVSGAHVEIRRTPDGWELVDLGSRNGTFLHGVHVSTVPLGYETRVRLGRPGGVEVTITVPGLEPAPDRTSAVPVADLMGRYLGDAEPEEMSERTLILRAQIQDHRKEEQRAWLGRTRRLRMAVGVLVLVSVAAGGWGLVQERRVRAQREAAVALFHTMKALELDLRRIQAAAGPDSTLRQRQARLEAQYDDLLTTMGIYSDRTPEHVQLIYRTVHRLGESEVNVPHEFVDEVLRYVDRWTEADLRLGLDRASASGTTEVVADILRQHNLPREFFFVALQESKMDPHAIGPSTRFGIPKGMWQMIPGTAEAYGLRLGPLQGDRAVDPADERHDVAKATAAAARYLSDLYETDAQASGLIVMAAYNMGQTRLLKLVRSMPESPAERNFWRLMERYRESVPSETYDYVYRIVSAAVIVADPQLFGFDLNLPVESVEAAQPEVSRTGADIP